MAKALKCNKKPKLTPQEILKSIINEDALSLRKNKQVVEIKEEEVIEKKVEELKWWQVPMDKKLFTKKKLGNQYYGHYEAWGDNVWIGAYDSSKELDEVIKSYVEETKKPISDRKINNIKSIILKIDKKC